MENTFGGDTDEDITDWGQENVEEDHRLVERLQDALRLILPMAKGYACEHPVGDNAGKCASAEKLLCEIEAKEPA